MADLVRERALIIDERLTLKDAIATIQRVYSKLPTCVRDRAELEADIDGSLWVLFQRPATALELHKTKYHEAAKVAAKADGYQPRPWESGRLPDRYYPPFIS